jgi:hypothetical protein
MRLNSSRSCVIAQYGVELRRQASGLGTYGFVDQEAATRGIHDGIDASTSHPSIQAP